MSAPTVSYALPSDLSRFCTSAQSIATVALDVQLRALETASRDFDNAIKSIFTEVGLPLTQWDDSVRKRVCQVACYEIFRVRGFDPNKGSDYTIMEDRKRAEAWMMSVQRQEIRPYMVGQVLAPNPVNQPVVTSKPQRGW